MIKRLSLPLVLLLLSLAPAGAAATPAPMAHAAVEVYQVQLHVTNDSSQTVRLNSHWGGDFSPSDPPALAPGASQTVTMSWTPSYDDLYHHPDAVFELFYLVTTSHSETVYAKLTVTALPGSNNAVTCSDQGPSWPLVLFSCQLDAKGYHPTAQLTLTNAPYRLTVTNPRIEWNGAPPVFNAVVPKDWHGDMKLLDDFGGKTQVVGTTQIVDGIASWQPQGNALAVGDHRIYAQATAPPGAIEVHGQDRTSNAVTISVVRARPTIRLEADSNTLTYGQSPIVTAVTGADVTGRLDFYAATKKGCDGSQESGAGCEYMGSASLVDGVAKLTKPNTPPGPGTHELFATYPGDGDYSETVSNLFPIAVERRSTPMSLDIDTDDGRNDSFMNPPSFIVTMPKDAAGTVVFFASRYVAGQPRNGCDGGDNGGTAPAPGCEVFGTAEIKDGVARLALRHEAVSAGIWVVHAFYWGDAGYEPGNSNTFQAGIPRSAPSMHLTSSATDIPAGYSPSFTVVMPAAAQGPVMFYDDFDGGCDGGTSSDAACVPLGAAELLDGVAKLKLAKALSSGRNLIHATFGGDDNFFANTSNVVALKVR
jgi:hypothetical protein